MQCIGLRHSLDVASEEAQAPTEQPMNSTEGAARRVDDSMRSDLFIANSVCKADGQMRHRTCGRARRLALANREGRRLLSPLPFLRGNLSSNPSKCSAHIRISSALQLHLAPRMEA